MSQLSDFLNGRHVEGECATDKRSRFATERVVGSVQYEVYTSSRCWLGTLEGPKVILSEVRVVEQTRRLIFSGMEG